jgi:hypothetical protein
MARIERALADAGIGVSSAVVVRGEPGIGKTSLLPYALQEAGGMRVLSARGVEFEADVPFAGLHELLRPALEVLDRLPPVNARALRGALGLGERVESDRLVIGAATLELLTTWAETSLLVVLDDAQWLDSATAEAIAFAVRRLLADPVAVPIAVRDGEPAPLVELGLPELSASPATVRMAVPQPPAGFHALGAKSRTMRICFGSWQHRIRRHERLQRILGLAGCWTRLE